MADADADAPGCLRPQLTSVGLRLLSRLSLSLSLSHSGFLPVFLGLSISKFSNWPGRKGDGLLFRAGGGGLVCSKTAISYVPKKSALCSSKIADVANSFEHDRKVD